MFWIGLFLWLILPLIVIASGAADAQQNLTPIEWLGAGLSIGSLVIWAAIIAAKST